MKKPEEAYEGEWDFDGSCAPNEDGSGRTFQGQETFTLGVFQWEQMKSRKGLKKGKVQKRIKGTVSKEGIADAYAKARSFCAERNAAAKP